MPEWPGPGRTERCDVVTDAESLGCGRRLITQLRTAASAPVTMPIRSEPGIRYGLILIGPDFHRPLRVAVPRSICAGSAGTIVSNWRNEPQSRPQSCDR